MTTSQSSTFEHPHRGVELERVAQFVCKNESPLVRTMHSISSHYKYKYNKTGPLWDLDSCVLVFLRLMLFLRLLLLLLIEMLYCVLVLIAGNESFLRLVLFLPLLLLLIEMLYCVFVLTVRNESFYV